MTLPTTYTALTQSIQEELEDTGSPFVLNIPTAIKMAEDRINREVDGLFQQTTTTLNLVINNNSVNKPTGYRFAFNLFLRAIGSNSRSLLKKMPKDFLTDYWPDSVVVNTPKYYADNSLTDFVVAPTPDAGYFIDMDYAMYPPYLTQGNQTNAIINKYPDLLWFASLIEQTAFARMYEASTLYESRYQQRLMQIKEETRRERADSTYQVATNFVTQNRLDKKG